MNPKHFYLTFLMILSCTFVYADDISEQQAQNVASQTLASFGQSPINNGKRKTRNRNDIQPILAYTQHNEKGSNNLYVFNNNIDNGGFVIVAGCDNLNELVVGYSDHGSFSYDTAPCALKALLQQFSKQIDIIRAKPSYVAPRKVRHNAVTMGNVVVQPLIKAQWNQCAPYNDMCPIYEGDEHTFNGCVSTAMAQIMYYWKYPKQGRGSIAYSFYPHIEGNNYVPDLENRRDLSADFSQSVYDWDNMLNDYTDGYNQQQGDAVALLMKDVGIGVQTSYGYEYGSAANSINIQPALINYFDYNSDSIQTVHRILYVPDGADDNFDELLKRELDARRPAILTGQPAITISSHAMIVDGYTDQDFFHINFGWGGQCDGYYQTTLIDVKTINPEYRTQRDWLDQYAIIGICPNYSHKLNDCYYHLEGEEATLSFAEAKGVVNIPQTIIAEGKSYTVTSVASYVFKEKEGITEVKLPNTISKFGNQVFYECKDLVSVTLPNSLEIIPDDCFRDCKKLANVSQPTNLKGIGTYAFAGTKISGFNIPQSMTIIPEGLFYGCTELTQTIIHSGVEEIGDHAYEGCTKLTSSLSFPASLKKVRKKAFANSGVSYVILNGPIDLAEGAFAASKLTSLYPDNNLINIGDNALGGTQLLSIDLDNVETIGDRAFAGCSKLSQITIGPSLKEFGRNVFLACNSLTNVTIDEDNHLLKYVDGVFYNRDMSVLIYCTPTIYHQYGFGSRNEFSVPENVVTIEPQALSALRESFYQITIPSSVKEIGEGALSNARNLKHVYNYATTPQVIQSVPTTGGKGVFNPWVFDRPDYDKCTLHVLPGCKDTYQAAEGWNQFEVVVEDLAIDGESMISEDTDPLKVRNGVMLRFITDMYEFEDVEDNRYVEFKFMSHPKLTYNFVDHESPSGESEFAEELIFTVDEMEEEVVFDHSMLLGVYFTHQFDEEVNPTDISVIELEHPVFDMKDRGIDMNNLAPGTIVSVSSLDGKLIKQTTVANDGKATINISKSSGSIYIIKVGALSFKIRMK